jgi:hypothetical protein
MAKNISSSDVNLLIHSFKTGSISAENRSDIFIPHLPFLLELLIELARLASQSVNPEEWRNKLDGDLHILCQLWQQAVAIESPPAFPAAPRLGARTW